ncbi:MAG: Thiamine pyrophosphate TPP-binding domain-containing protein [Parcubacteria group bacterium GW2011_GWA2_49_9]|nr:MAG: Thiamine pyrophosphate TPP-binding domain-containing protein [Parcubacteria group bacterium GW2011_GWA2_49_9]
MKVSDALVTELARQGVKYIFGVPGEENLDLLDSISRSHIPFVLTRHEQAAGFMAATIGRLTGKAGVALSTLGPGATNLATAAAYATLGAMPAIFITGQKSNAFRKQGAFQIVDTVGMFKPLTRFSASIASEKMLTPLLKKAFAVAEGERPGAVHLELPENIAAMDFPKPDKTPILTPLPVPPNTHALVSAAKALLRAKRPVLLIGMRANTPSVARELTLFIQETGIPFVTTQMGKGVVREDHPLYLGTTAVTSGDYVHTLLGEADTVLCVGHETVEKPPFVIKNGNPLVIHLNVARAGNEPVYIPRIEVVGDIATGLRMLKESLKGENEWEQGWFTNGQRETETCTKEKSSSPHFPLLPQRIVADIRSAMPETGIVTLDNGMCKLWFARSYRALGLHTLLLDNALATMGAGLPSAIAAKLVHPKRKVLTVCGDGGFMMSSQELETAVRLKLDLVIVVIRDNGFGMIQWKQEADGFKKFGLSYGNPDFAAYARSFGAKGHRVTQAKEFLPLLTKALGEKGVSLIDVPVDYSENAKVFTKLTKKL